MMELRISEMRKALESLGADMTPQGNLLLTEMRVIGQGDEDRNFIDDMSRVDGNIAFVLGFALGLRAAELRQLEALTAVEPKTI